MTYGIIGIKPQIIKAKIAGTKLYVKFFDGRELYIPKKLFPFLKGKKEKCILPMAKPLFLITPMK
ncbi:MAG TPA: hypothetical protein VMU83_23045 [Hanamia sp.]|nr:hypothetical protein [Hanamia sp.]